MKIKILSVVLVFASILLTSCRETVTEREVVREKEEVRVEENREGIIERTGKKIDSEVNKEIDKEIDKIGGNN